MPEGESTWRLALVAVTGLAIVLLRSLRLSRARAASQAKPGTPSSNAPSTELDKAQARASAILNATDEALLLCDAEGLVTDFNRQAVHIFGHQPAEALGKEVHRLIFPSPMDMIFQSTLDRFLADNEQATESTETTAQHKNGARFAVQFTVARLEADNAGFALCIRDIGQEREAQLQLEQTLAEAQRSQKELEQFARFAANRELKMISLKEEVNELLKLRHMPPRYSIPDANSGSQQVESAATTEPIPPTSATTDWGM